MFLPRFLSDRHLALHERLLQEGASQYLCSRRVKLLLTLNRQTGTKRVERRMKGMEVGSSALEWRNGRHVIYNKSGRGMIIQ